MVHFFLAESAEDEELLSAHLALAVGRAEHVVPVGVQVASEEAADGDPSGEPAVIEGGDLELGRALHIRSFRNRAEDGVHEEAHVRGGVLPIRSHPAHFGRAEHRGEVELLFGGPEVEHQIEDLFLNEVGGAVLLVHLVDHHDGGEPEFERLAQDETRLGHGPFEGVDQEQHSVRHLEHALHLTAEVGVAGGVDEVDLDILVVGRHILGQDGDPALALEVVVVEDQVAGRLAGIDDVAVVDDLVHQGGLAVVDVGDDRDVAESAHGRGSDLGREKTSESAVAHHKVLEMCAKCCGWGFGDVNLREFILLLRAASTSPTTFVGNVTVPTVQRLGVSPPVGRGARFAVGARRRPPHGGGHGACALRPPFQLCGRGGRMDMGP